MKNKRELLQIEKSLKNILNEDAAHFGIIAFQESSTYPLVILKIFATLFFLSFLAFIVFAQNYSEYFLFLSSSTLFFSFFTYAIFLLLLSWPLSFFWPIKKRYLSKREINHAFDQKLQRIFFQEVNDQDNIKLYLCFSIKEKKVGLLEVGEAFDKYQRKVISQAFRQLTHALRKTKFPQNINAVEDFFTHIANELYHKENKKEGSTENTGQALIDSPLNDDAANECDSTPDDSVTQDNPAGPPSATDPR